MTRVEVLKDQRDRIVGFKVEGHTGFDDVGQDIVCAGVSALTQTALLGLLNYLEKKPGYKLAPGLLVCSLPPALSREDEQKAQAILGTMEIGLKEIASNYRDFVRLEVRRC